MKLETTIIPRRDGAVTVQAPSRAYRFLPDDHGRMVAEVESETDIAFLLALKDFTPADEEDFDVAAQLTKQNDGGEPPFIDDGNVVGEVEDLPDDEPENEDAAPIEEPRSAVAAPPAAPVVATARIKRK